MEETPKKIVGNNCFLCSFPLIPQARIRVFGKSSVDIAHLIECAVEIDLSVFSSSNPFVCNRCYKRLLRFEKAKPNLRSLQEEIKEDFKKGANRTKRLRRNSAMTVNKIDRQAIHDSYGSCHWYICRLFFGLSTFLSLHYCL